MQVQAPRDAPFDNIPQACPEIFIARGSKTMKMPDKINANVNPYQTTINPTITQPRPAQILRISSAILHSLFVPLTAGYVANVNVIGMISV